MKKLVFSLVLLLLLGLCLELAGRVALRHMNGRWMSASEVVASLAGEPTGDAADLDAALAPGTDAPSYLRQHILHPYLGFVRNPDIAQHEFIERTIPDPVNEFGFFGPNPMDSSSDDSFHVFLTGGSLALELYIDAGDQLQDLIAGLPMAAGKPVIVYDLALGGMKQPQQTLLLTYLFSFGAQPDLVIALDGFNEVVLAPAENMKQGVHPFFPRKWQIYGKSSVDLETAMMAGTIANQRAAIQDSKQAIRHSPLRKTSIGVALWQASHQKKATARTNAELALQERLSVTATNLTAQLTGPAFRPPNDKYAIVGACAEMWKRSVENLWFLCRERDVAFLQCLQPNQYVADSKPLSEWEQEHAIAPEDYIWRIFATAGYGKLMEQGAELAASGVPYADLTDVFAGVPDTIYKDSCCHVNEKGARLIAERITAELAAQHASLRPE